MSNLSEIPWDEKYRPKTIDEIILPGSIKKMAKDIVASGDTETLLFLGKAGCGKTTLAQAIAHELDADFMKINASINGIDVIRNDVEQFASTVSLTGGKKITLLDEADGLSRQAQDALRGFVEAHSTNHSFIYTCNYVTKIIPAIRSRAKQVPFKFTSKDKKEMSTQFLKRVVNILKEEGVDYDSRVVAELILKKFPDFRSVLVELQVYAKSGKIDAGILMTLDGIEFDELITAMKAKRFNDVRKWVGEHADIEPEYFFRTMYDKSKDILEPKSVPELVLTLGEYSYKSAFVADQEINTMAFLTALLLSDGITWKL